LVRGSLPRARTRKSFQSRTGPDRTGPDRNNLAGMAGAEEDEPGQKAARLAEEVEQLLSGDRLRPLVLPGRLELVQTAVAGPVDQVVVSLEKAKP